MIHTSDLCPSCRPYPNFRLLGPSTEQLWALEAGWLITRLLSGYHYNQQHVRPPYINHWHLHYMWPDLRKPDIIAHFSNSILLHFDNVHTQMHVLVKFQLRILKAFEFIALQSNSNRKIDLYSKHRENKLQALPKTDVTYKWSEVGTRILHHHIRHELRNGLLG